MCVTWRVHCVHENLKIGFRLLITILSVSILIAFSADTNSFASCMVVAWMRSFDERIFPEKISREKKNQFLQSTSDDLQWIVEFKGANTFSRLFSLIVSNMQSNVTKIWIYSGSYQTSHCTIKIHTFITRSIRARARSFARIYSYLCQYWFHDFIFGHPHTVLDTHSCTHTNTNTTGYLSSYQWGDIGGGAAAPAATAIAVLHISIDRSIVIFFFFNLCTRRNRA